MMSKSLSCQHIEGRHLTWKLLLLFLKDGNRVPLPFYGERSKLERRVDVRWHRYILHRLRSRLINGTAIGKRGNAREFRDAFLG